MACAHPRCKAPVTQHAIAFLIEAPSVPPGQSRWTKSTGEAHRASLSGGLCDRHARVVYKLLKRALTSKPFKVEAV